MPVVSNSMRQDMKKDFSFSEFIITIQRSQGKLHKYIKNQIYSSGVTIKESKYPWQVTS